MPLPHTKVIHPRWSAHHQATAAGGMTAKCRITPPPSAVNRVFNEALGYSVDTTPATLYEDACRVERNITSAGSSTVAGRDVPAREYLVALLAKAPDIPIGAVVTITECEQSPTLVGKVLHVNEARDGSVSWQRNLIAVEQTNTAR